VRKFLTPDQRLEIMRLYLKGEKVDAIAAAFGVGRTYPTQLCHRRGLPKRRQRGSAPQREEVGVTLSAAFGSD